MSQPTPKRPPITFSEAPLPDKAPGAFLRLQRERETGEFVVHLDDGKWSSYTLGDQPAIVARILGRWTTHPTVAGLVVDLACDFGGCQWVFAGNRTIALKPKQEPTDVFAEPDTPEWSNPTLGG